MPHRDPTARRAEKSVGLSGLAFTISLNGAEPVRVSKETLKLITGLLDIQYSPKEGEFFATLNENAAALLEQDGRGASPKGHE